MDYPRASESNKHRSPGYEVGFDVTPAFSPQYFYAGGQTLKIGKIANFEHLKVPFSYPEPFLRAVNGARRGALA
jgi:hypothetical protein